METVQKVFDEKYGQKRPKQKCGLYEFYKYNFCNLMFHIKKKKSIEASTEIQSK